MGTRTIGTDIKLTGEKAFNDAMRSMNSNLKTLRSDMAAVTAEFDGNADSAEALETKQKILQASVEQHQAKVDALRRIYNQVAESAGENSAQADKWKQQLNYATAALSKETAALEKNTEAMNQSDAKKFNENMATIDHALKTLASDMAVVTAKFDGNADSAEALEAKQKILQASVEQHQAKVDALQEKYNQVAEAYGETSAQAGEWKQNLNQATVALIKETAALEKNADAMNQLGAKEFAADMNAVDRAIKTLASDMAVVTAEFDGNADSAEALEAKQKILQASVEQHQAKVDALQQKYNQVAEAYGENSAQADEWKQSLNQATAALIKETQTLEKNASALKKAQDEGKKYVPITQRLAASVKKTWKNIKEFASNTVDKIHHLPVFGEMMDVIGVCFNGLGKAAKIAEPAVKGLVKATGSIATGAAKGTVSAISGITKGIGSITTASIAAAGAVSAAGVVALTTMVGFAKDAADAAKQAQEAGEALTDSQQQWLAYANQLDSLDTSVASAKAALGGVLLPVLSDLSTEGAAFLNDFSRDMEAAAGDSKQQSKILSDYIVKGANLIKTKLPEYVALGKELLSSLGEGLAESGPELLDIGMDLVMDLLDGLIEFAPELGQAGIALVEKLTESLIERGPDLLTSAVELVAQIVTGLGQAAPEIIPAAANLVMQLILALIAAAPQLLEAGLELVYGIISGITGALGEIAGSADAIIETVRTAFGDNAARFLEIGLNIVKGIGNGIKNGMEWLCGLISSWCDDIVGWIKNKLGIASPSKVMEREVGYWIAQGIGTGFLKEMENVNRLIADSIDTSFSIPEYGYGSRASGRYYRTAGNKIVNLYITAKSLTEADINMLLDLVNRKLGEDL